MPPPPVLYRFSSLARITAFVAEGRVFFNHARNFTAGELMPGQQDNEQERLYAPDARHLRVSVGNPERGPLSLTNLTDFRIAVSLSDIHGDLLNYYLLCCSLHNDSQMFSEFAADAFVEFHDPAEFFHRLEASVHEQLPGFGCHGRSVEYYPRKSLPMKSETWEFIFCKDDVFAYQREFRFTLVGPPEQSIDDRKELMLGPLSDICTVHTQ